MSLSLVGVRLLRDRNTFAQFRSANLKMIQLLPNSAKIKVGAAEDSVVTDLGRLLRPSQELETSPSSPEEMAALVTCLQSTELIGHELLHFLVSKPDDSQSMLRFRSSLQLSLTPPILESMVGVSQSSIKYVEDAIQQQRPVVVFSAVQCR